MYCLLSFCCVCLNDRDELHNLSNTDVDNVQLLDKLNFCAFENEWIQSNFPIFICYKCCHNLRIAYEFKRMCHKNNKLLRGYIHQFNFADLNEPPQISLQKEIKQPILDSKLIQDTVIAQYCKTELNDQIFDSSKQSKQNDIGYDVTPPLPGKPIIDSQVSFTPEGNHRNNKKNHNCTICNKSFTRKLHLERHLLTHSGKRSHHCTLCSKSFILKSHLNGHMLTHTGIKSHCCSFCNKNFARKSDLHRHMLIHNVEKSYSCSFCHKGFARKSHLARHMIFHSGNRPHHCNICSKSFILKSHLNDHMLTHSGIKSHHCTLCMKSFGRKSDLNRHMLTHNNNRNNFAL